MLVNRNEFRIAMLVDAENVSEKFITYILDELAAEYGKVTVRRVYGDWSSTSLSKWRDSVVNFALSPIQQFNNIKSKNSSDSAMIIDAMDILYTGDVDGFCLVSSDSDFTRLASRLREAGKFVLGMGEKKTPLILKAACTRFINLEVLLPQGSSESKSTGKATAAPKEEEIFRTPTEEEMSILNKLHDIAVANVDDDNWANLADVGNILRKQLTDFDPRSYGCKSISDFVKKFPQFIEIKVVMSSNATSKHYYIRFKH